jgi:uncharacterized membrane-anchored protein
VEASIDVFWRHGSFELETPEDVVRYFVVMKRPPGIQQQSLGLIANGVSF